MISLAVWITGIYPGRGRLEEVKLKWWISATSADLEIFFEEQDQIEIPERELVAGWYPPSPRISGIIELGENQKKIYGAQSVTAKILSAKNLDVHPWRRVPETGRISQVHRLATSAMMAHFECDTQGQMSHGGVENIRSRGDRLRHGGRRPQALRDVTATALTRP